MVMAELMGNATLLMLLGFAIVWAVFRFVLKPRKQDK